VKAQVTAIVGKWWPLLALLLAVAVVIAFGGFGKRSDIFTATDVGAEIDCGNLIFAFSGATAQHVVSEYSPPRWEVVAIGTVRNPNDEALQPLFGDYGQFAFKDPASDQVVVPFWGNSRIGGESLRSYVPPGMPSTSIDISVSMDESYSPGSDIILAVDPAENTDNGVLGLSAGRKNWNKDSLAPVRLLNLPLTILPERKG
jgi:hypothetical protein